MSIQTRTAALQNEVVRLYFTFQTDGQLANPSGQPTVEIIDTDGVTVLDHINPSIENTGIWYADWYVPADLAVGDYYDRWTFQWATTSSTREKTLIFSVYSLDSYINFVSTGIDHNISNRARQLMLDLSNDFIDEAMRIPVYFEQAMRIQQDNSTKRNETYYYFTLDSDSYSVTAGAVYKNNEHLFTITKDLVPFFSSSSESSESVGTSSSSSSSASSSSSSSSESEGTTTTTTIAYVPSGFLSSKGTGDPQNSGLLTKISGTGNDTITFSSYSKESSMFSTRYQCAYKNWLKDPRPIVRVNARIIDDGWYLDYDGNIFFDSAMSPEDSVNIKYFFSYFRDEEILGFLRFGLQMMNSVPPASVIYGNINIMPSEWNAPVLLYAAILALRRLIFGISWQEKRIIYGRPEDAEAAASRFQTMLSEYSTIWDETAKNAKTRKLPGVAQYVTPEYTLPGGRSRWFRYLFKSGA